MILSVSRRTDIPAFYPEWFYNRVKAGEVCVRNAFNYDQISRIPLNPDVVDCIVFWTKNAAPMLPYLDEIAAIYDDAFYFQYSINAYEPEMEPAVPPLSDRIRNFCEMSQKYGKERMVWRYDPILLSDKYTLEWHEEHFRNIFSQLKNDTDTCVISFIDMYDRTKNNTKTLGIRALTVQEMNWIAERFSAIAADSGVQLRTCAEGIDLQKYNILPNSCIDRQRIEDIIGWEIKAKKDNQREFCGCIECADIGQYNTCKHGCKYCYANYSPTAVKNASDAHDDLSPLLTGVIEPRSKVTDYKKAKSLKEKRIPKGQTCLFDV